MSNHNGHRERLKEKFIKNNGRNLEDHELLELLLFYSKPRVNTNDTAHDLISEFGTLNGVFDANISELGRIKGVGDNSALLIKVVSELISRHYLTNEDPRKQYNKFSEIADYLRGLFVGKSSENIYLLLFNNSMRLIKTLLVGDGTVNMATLVPKMVVEPAIINHASYAIVAHNHPAGLAIPSSEDINTSYVLRSAFNIVDITLIDHFLVADGKCVPIIRSADKCGIKEELRPQDYIFKANEFEIQDDLEYELIE